MKRLAAPLFVVLAVASCGSGKPAITRDASQALQPKIAAIRMLASAREASALRAALAELRADVDRLQRDEELSPDAAEKILDAVTNIENNVPLITTTTTTAPPPSEDEDDDDRGKGKGHDD